MDKALGLTPLGELLVEWELVPASAMEVALNESDKRGLPLGLVLIMHDFIDTDTLHSAIAAQSFMRDQLISAAETSRAMALVKRKHVSFGLALDLLGIESTSRPRNRLGELLVESDSISRDQIKSRLSLAKMTGLPLGRVLVSVADLHNDFIDLALNLQDRVRLGDVSRDDAVDRLYSARRCIEVISNVGHGGLTDRTRVGRLMVDAGLIEERHVQAALSVANARGLKIGEALVELRIVRREVIVAVLAAQRLIREGKLALANGLSELKKLKPTSAAEAAHEEAEAEEKEKGVSFYCFLKLAHLLPGSPPVKESPGKPEKHVLESQLEDTWQELKSISPPPPTQPRLPDDVREMLERCGFKTDAQQVAVQRAGRTYMSYREKRLSLEQALIQFQCLQIEAAEPGQWSGTFPSLPVL